MTRLVDWLYEAYLERFLCRVGFLCMGPTLCPRDHRKPFADLRRIGLTDYGLDGRDRAQEVDGE